MAKGTVFIINTSFLLEILFVLLFVFCFSESVTNAVTLSPGVVAPVCQDGGPLELTCITNGSFMRWNITARNKLGTFQDYGPLFVIAEDAAQQTSSATVDSTTFTTMRISDQGSLPLISTMVINPVNRDLNGTIVNCEDVGTSMTHTASVASTTIHYVDKTPSGFIMFSISEEYSTDYITIVVEWTQQEGVLYNITTVPMVPMIDTGSTSVQFIVSYNTEYNVSVEAATVCQRVAVSHIQLFYAKCGILLSAAHSKNPNVTFSGLPIEGTVANFSCPPGMVLNGTNTTIATCTRYGEWQPDPQDINCVEATCEPFLIMISNVNMVDGDDSISANLGTTFNFTCPSDLSLVGPNSTTCNGNGEWEPDPSGVMCTKGNITSTNTMPLMTWIIIGGSSFAGICLLIILTICSVIILIRMRRKSSFKRSATHDVHRFNVAQLQGHEEASNAQIESEYSVLQHVHDRSGTQRATIMEIAAPKTPDILHGLQSTMVYVDLSVSSKKNSSMPSALDLDDYRVQYSEINHKIQKENCDKPQILPDTGNDDNLHIDDVNLDSLLIQLRKEVTPKWYKFGEVAGIKSDVLDNFAKNCIPDDCVVETFDYWLRNYEGKPTWRDVANVLRAINLEQLAFDIEQVYITGKLPIETDDGVPSNLMCMLNTKLLFAPEIVPPIPPKTTKVNDGRAPMDHQSNDIGQPDCKQSNQDEPPPRPPKAKSGAIISAGVGVPIRPPKC